jgi:nicotinamidase-related amidase
VVAPASDIARVWQESNTIARGWHPSEKEQSILRSLEQRVAPAHTALVVIDMQESPAAGSSSADADNAAASALHSGLPQARAVLERARRAGVFVIHVRSEYGQDVFNVGRPGRYGNGGRGAGFLQTLSATEFEEATTTRVRAEAASSGSEFIDGFAPLEDEPVVTKHRFSAFRDTDLELLLRSNGIRTVVAIGCDTNCCVDSTARDAAMRDYYVVIPEDCMLDDADPHRREANLETLRRHFGLVCPSLRLISAWPAVASVS